MSNLGSFGTPRPALEGSSFTYCGEVTIRLNPDATDLGMMQFLTAMSDMDRLTEAEGAKLTGQLVTDCIHPEDMQLFWDTARKYRQQTQDVMAVIMQLVSAVSGFPTTPSADSSTGSSETEPRRGGRSSSPGGARARRQAAAQAMKQLHGRPDLKEAIRVAQEHADART